MSLLRLGGGPGVYPDCGRAGGLAHVDPNFAKAAIGVLSEDRALLFGAAASARSDDVDGLLGDVQIVGGIPRAGSLDLTNRSLLACGGDAANGCLALDKMESIGARDTGNVGRIGFDCVSLFSCTAYSLLADRALNFCELTVRVGTEHACFLSSSLSISLFAGSFADLAELPVPGAVGKQS